MKKSITLKTGTTLTLALLLVLFSPLIRAQTEFAVEQCTTSEEAIAIIDSVLLFNVEDVFKKNITITGDTGAIGYYTGGELFGFAESAGIILSTGFSGAVEGANTCTGFLSGNNSGGSDPDLSSLSGQVINDACIVEFDLMLFHDSVFLSYVFGSEEYHEWVNTAFNDVFGFFVSGPGINVCCNK